jgi:hypothetical protein
MSMEGTVGAPPQRVCPKCARISWATGPRCPYCRGRFRRQSTATIAWMLALAVVVTLAGMAAMLLIAAQHFQDELNDRSAQIERNFDGQLTRIQQDVQNQLNAQPTPTPFLTPTPTPTPSPTASPSPSATPASTKTPKASSTPIITP